MVDYGNVINVGIGMIIIIGIGFFMSKKGIFIQKDSAPVNLFVFKVCFFFLLARALASRKLSELDFRPFLIAGLMCICVFIVFTLIFAFPLKEKFALYISSVLPATYINYIISGIPIFNSLWPEKENVMVSLMTLSNDIVTAPIFLILVGFYNVKQLNKKRIEEGLEPEEFSFSVLGKILLNVIKSPILLGNILGMLYSLTGLKVPVFLQKLMQYMGDTALPLALFGVGVFLAQHSLMSCHWLQFALCAIGRFFVGSTFAAIFCYLLKLPPRLSRQCIIIGAQPTAVATYVLSSSAGIGQNVASTMIFWTTILTVPVIIAWFSILDGLGLFIE